MKKGSKAFCLEEIIRGENGGGGGGGGGGANNNKLCEHNYVLGQKSV